MSRHRHRYTSGRHERDDRSVTACVEQGDPILRVQRRAADVVDDASLPRNARPHVVELRPNQNELPAIDREAARAAAPG
jgi:hypothetical protein